MDKIPFHKIENFTGASCYAVPKALVIKHNDYFIDDTISVDGDAPKKFIGVYDYRLLNGKHKANRKNWIRYIAKTGHKWYPIESVTELLLNRLFAGLTNCKVYYEGYKETTFTAILV